MLLQAPCRRPPNVMRKARLLRASKPIIVRPMTAKELRSEFRAAAIGDSRTAVYDERTALELIDRAEREYVAVIGVEAIRDPSQYAAPEGESLTDMERIKSWNNAREFVKDLCGRGLYFDVVLESPLATFLAKLKYLFRNGVQWDPDDRGRRTPPMVG